MSGASNFIKVAGQIVREDAVTRLSSTSAAGVEVLQHYVHFIDGGTAAVSEVEYRRLVKRFASTKSGRKSA
jgi:hypothetical protein